MNKSIIYIVLITGMFSFSGCGLLMLPEIKKLEKEEIFSISKEEDAILLEGVINSSALEKFTLLAEQYPQVKKLLIINCDGSVNDEVNLKLARYIHKNGFDIHLQENGLIASGGTDLFLAGHKRTKGINTRIGVHSWGGLFKTATDFPKGHEHHLPYIDYYKSIGFSQKEAEDFYYFTIYSAPSDDIHWMTEEEILKYKMVSI